MILAHASELLSINFDPPIRQVTILWRWRGSISGHCIICTGSSNCPETFLTIEMKGRVRNATQTKTGRKIGGSKVFLQLPGPWKLRIFRLIRSWCARWTAAMRPKFNGSNLTICSSQSHSVLSAQPSLVSSHSGVSNYGPWTFFTTSYALALFCRIVQSCFSFSRHTMRI